MNKIKVARSFSGKGTSKVEAVYLNGKKLGGIEDIAIMASADRPGITQVLLKIYADVDFVEAKNGSKTSKGR